MASLLQGTEIRMSKSLAQRTAISRAYDHVEVSVDQLARHPLTINAA